MNIEFVKYNGIKDYAKIMYNDVKKASEDVKIEVCYDGKDIKALLEYLFMLEKQIENQAEITRKQSEKIIPEHLDLHNRINKAIEYIKSYLPNYSFDHYDLEKLLDMLEGEDNER